MVDSLSQMVLDEETVLAACGDRELPRMGLVEQVWDTDPVPAEDVADVAADQVGALDLDSIPDGGEVAVGAGSRGIANIPEIVRGTVEGLSDRGFSPFVFPAMGSHGGATAEGQREQLAALGMTEETVGCEIRATMDVVEVGRTPDRGVSLYVDENAHGADAIVPVNRIKPHTMFVGDVESGLSKMLVIGMAKQEGAKTTHEWAVDWSFRNMIPEIADSLIDILPVAGGIATVENEHHDTELIEGVPPEGFLDREAELLEMAYDRMAMLPWEELEAVVFDQMGKDISGAGMDTNVTGRIPFFYEPEPETPAIKRIFTRSLTEGSHGNAAGLGNADFVHRRLFEAYDPSATGINGLTASSVRPQSLPPVLETDRAGLVAALSTVGVEYGSPETVRAVRATDTQRLKRVYASEALVEDARERDDLAVVREPEPVEFDDGGEFVAPSPTEVTPPPTT